MLVEEEGVSEGRFFNLFNKAPQGSRGAFVENLTHKFFRGGVCVNSVKHFL